jgi:hypothetical protein
MRACCWLLDLYLVGRSAGSKAAQIVLDHVVGIARSICQDGDLPLEVAQRRRLLRQD